MTTTPTATLSLTPAETAALRNIAAINGYTIGRGPKATQGSINQLCKALAAGDLIVKRAQWIPNEK